MTKEELLQKLTDLGKDRHWLASASKYDYRTVNNKLGPSGKISDRMMQAFERAILEEERRKNIDLEKPGSSVWDMVLFTGAETQRIFEAQRIGGYSKIEDLYHDAVMDYCDGLIANEKITSIHELPFLGSAAAGQPVSSTLTGETVVVPREFPEGHFVIEIDGQSAEPEYMDGERWIIDGRDCYTPKSGKPCIVSDENGSYLKKWNRQRKAFESINPDFDDVIPGEGATLQGYPVEKLD